MYLKSKDKTYSRIWKAEYQKYYTRTRFLLVLLLRLYISLMSLEQLYILIITIEPKEKKSYSTSDRVSKIRECIGNETVSFLVHSGKIHTLSGFNFRALLLSLPTVLRKIKRPFSPSSHFFFFRHRTDQKGKTHSTVMWLTKLGATKSL